MIMWSSMASKLENVKYLLFKSRMKRISIVVTDLTYRLLILTSSLGKQQRSHKTTKIPQEATLPTDSQAKRPTRPFGTKRI